MADFMTLTSRLKTPLFVRKSVVLYAEGFDFTEEPNAGHRGARLTLIAGQWSDSVHCLETIEEVIKLLETHW